MSHTPVGPGFLTQLLTKHLTHLQHLLLQQSYSMLQAAEFKAIAGLKQLRSLEVLGSVLFSPNICDTSYV